MPLQTTVIGSYPKPGYLPTPDWFRHGMQTYSPEMYNQHLKKLSTPELDELTQKAMAEVIDEQVKIGIDVITDGEIPRENYVHHFCRRLEGFDFGNIVKKIIRNGASAAYMPVIVGEVTPGAKDSWCVEEWRRSQALTDRPAKMTIPGPMTIIGTTHNKFYEDEKELSNALVKCINREIRALEQAGCQYIQVDEPLLVRKPETALDYGIDHLAKCFEGVGPSVTRVVHLCCGYPDYLDQEDYLKADKNAYSMIADKMESAGLNAVSIEDAHRHLDLSFLQKFQQTSIILGVVAVARSRVETVEDITCRAKEALKFLPPERLILAPDCGLGYLPRDILRQKLTNMVTAAKSLP